MLKGGGSARGFEGRGAGGSSATFEGREEAAARLWRAVRIIEEAAARLWRAGSRL